MLIREERPADHDAAAALQRRAFGGPHGTDDHGPAVATLVGALRAYDPEALSLVAEEDGEIVGHVMFTRCLLDAPPRLVEVQCLSPLGVQPERQGTGIGQALVRQGLAELDRRGVPLVFLEGSPVYYARFGFEAAHRHEFRKPSLRIPDAGFQVVRLSAYEPWMTGTMVYSPVFWDLDLVGLR